MALPDCEELNGVKQFCKNCETELHSSELDVIQDTACSTYWLHSPTWIDFWVEYCVVVQSMLYAKRFLFFSACGIRPLFNRASFLRRILLLAGGSKASPCNPQHILYTISQDLQKHENKKGQE